MLEKRERGKERKDMREREREKLYLRDIYTYIDHRMTDGQAIRRTDKQTDEQRDRWPDRQTDRQQVIIDINYMISQPQVSYHTLRGEK